MVIVSHNASTIKPYNHNSHVRMWRMWSEWKMSPLTQISMFHIWLGTIGWK